MCPLLDVARSSRTRNASRSDPVRDGIDSFLCVCDPPWCGRYNARSPLRDDFTQNTKELLARRVGFRCSNPDRRKPTSGPQDDPRGSVNIGVASHIAAGFTWRHPLRPEHGWGGPGFNRQRHLALPELREVGR